MRMTRGTHLALFFAACVVACAASHAQSTASNGQEMLWYTTPAPVWDHALPIGNGRLGAMVFGGANAGTLNGDLQASPKNQPLLDGSQTSGADEHLQLNESSLWRGSRADRLNPRAHDSVPEIRKLLLKSNGLDGAKISAAEKLAQEDMIGIPAGMPGYSTLGDLYLRSQKHGPISDYRRQLDLNMGIVRVSYAIDGVHFTREVFASVPDEVIALRITADRKAAISFRATMDRPEDFSVSTRGNDTLVLREGPEHKDQIRFAGEALFIPTSGSVHADGSAIVVSDADSLTVLIAAATDFKGGGFPVLNPNLSATDGSPQHASAASTPFSPGMRGNTNPFSRECPCI